MSEDDLMMITEYNYDDLGPVCNKTDIQDLNKIILPVLYALVFVIGLVGNFLVVLTIMKGGHQKSMTDIFLLNLAMSDLIFVASLPFWASYVLHGWTLGNFSCKIVSSLYYVSYFGGMFFITVISIDRYLAIVRATFVTKTRTISHGYIMSLIVWLVAILFASPQFVFTQKLDNECTPVYPEHLNGIWLVFSYIELNIIGFLLPVSIMTFCYLRIIKTLISCKNNRKKKAMKLISLVVIVFLLFWTPYHISIFLQLLRLYEVFQDCSTLRFLDYTVQVTEPLAFSHCCLNPIIYAFAGEKFRKYLCRLVLKCLSFICFCGPCSKYHGKAPTPIPESLMTSNHTQNTSERDGSILL